jgi:hypothetical protein
MELRLLNINHGAFITNLTSSYILARTSYILLDDDASFVLDQYTLDFFMLAH